MDITAVHQKLADDDVLKNAKVFQDAVGTLLFEYTWVIESVEDCYHHLDEQGKAEAGALLRSVHETAQGALNTIESANERFRKAFGELEGFAKPLPPRDVYETSVVDALHTLGGVAHWSDIWKNVKQAMKAMNEPAWLGMTYRRLPELMAGDLLRNGPTPGTYELTDTGRELATQRAGA